MVDRSGFDTRRHGVMQNWSVQFMVHCNSSGVKRSCVMLYDGSCFMMNWGCMVGSFMMNWGYMVGSLVVSRGCMMGSLVVSWSGMVHWS